MDTNKILNYAFVDDMDRQEAYDETATSNYYTKLRDPKIYYIDQVRDDYHSYIGSWITPSGRVRSTPMSKKDAWRAAIDEYRKRRREWNTFNSIENYAENNQIDDDNNRPDKKVSFEILVNKIFDTLEEKDKDYEICRYLSAVLYNLDCVHNLDGKTRARVVKYLKTVNVKELGSTDKQLGIALNYEISAGSQCRKLVSIKKRLVNRMSSIGITRFDLGR